MNNKKKSKNFSPDSLKNQTKNIIEISHCVKKFKKIVAVNDVSLNIKAGERLALIGKNGAGKTTLLETILGINRASSGKITLNFDYEKSPLEKIGVQFQDSDYPEGLSVSDIIDFFTSINIYSMNSKKLHKMIKDFQIDEIIHYDAKSLSGGQRQKLNVLLAFVTNPKIIFLDELTTGLDIGVRTVITKYVENYIQENNATLLLISHNSAEIEWLCKRIIAMKDGKICYDASVNKVKQDYQSIENFMQTFL